MRKLSSLILAMAVSMSLFSQSSPHGSDFKISCTDCHTTEGWKVDLKTLAFDHNTTKFSLVGQHKEVDCRLCHKSLVFSNAGKECISCHTDMHQQTVGPDCGRCHTTNSWIVNNITDIHRKSRFPLVGPHLTADCYDCHLNASASNLNFGALGVQCYDCHQANYAATTTPNHTQAGYSTNCIECHSLNSFAWGAKVDHSFFPLTLGHAIDCRQCHTTGVFTNLPTTCVSCHLANYTGTTDPSHVAAQFPTTCEQCHTTNPGWKPATFDHTNFPLTLGHSGVDCNKCHINGNYTNTPTDCYACHEANYVATTNPPHVSLGLSTTCTDCHTTNPGWKPAQFTGHDAYFPIYSGKHNSPVWNQCSDCHTNPANYAEYTCISCHPHDNKTETDDQHKEVGGYLYSSPACYACHPTGSAEGGFNHNTLYPLTGAHTTTPCNQCHVSGYQNTPTICSQCHTAAYNQTTNPNHLAISIPNTCDQCHTTNPGWKPATFPIHGNYYPLTGAHATIGNNCASCHQGNYVNTPNTCAGCHQANYNATTNPNHAAINIPTTCDQCHTTNPNWTPATFPIHNNYYVLAGAHVAIANNCAMCHNGNYNSTPNTCVGCHQNDYNQTNNPPHAASQFPTTCTDCHTQTAWIPANWNHDGLYFPIYSGKHNGKWNTCADCHTNPANYAVFTCTTSCHPQSSTDNDHQGVSGYSYNSAACYNCHPKGSGGKMMEKSIINRTQ